MSQVLAVNANRIPELAELDALAALPRLQELALQVGRETSQLDPDSILLCR
jgi:hypothetical protein